MVNPDVRLSVVIPTYNRSAMLDRCIRSIRKAGLSDVQIIVADDGGTDDTETVALAHSVEYLRQANAGPAAARNLGFSASHGRYIAFIDSDDEWIHGGATRLIEHLEANPDVDVAFADSLMGDEASGFVSFVRTYGTESFFTLPHSERPGGVRVLERQPFFLQLSTRNVMFLGSMLIRRELVVTLGGFERQLWGTEDWNFFMRATAAGIVAFSDGPALSRYYKHGAGISADRDRMELGFIQALDSVRRRSTLDPVERRHVDERLRAHIFDWAWGAYDCGDFATARKRLLMAREMGQLRSREAVYLAATYLPPSLLRTLRGVRRAFGSRA